AALSEACRSRVVRIVAVPVEYKPGLRCVIRYDVATTRGPLVVFGKVYPDVAQATATHRLTARLWQRGPSAAPLVPRPLDLLPDPGRVGHGEVRAGQLTFCPPGSVVITDLGTACLGDPAFDVGCLMAYPRPPALWRGSADACAWFPAARKKFLDAYRADDALRRRAALYEAVFVLKNVSRRTRNVNSP